MKLTDVFLYGSRDEPPDLPSSKQLLPHLLDILEFLSSKWLTIINLHSTGEAMLVFMNLFRNKIPHNLAVLSSSFMLRSDNVN